MVEMVIQQISNAELQLGTVSFHLVFAKPAPEIEVVKALVVQGKVAILQSESQVEVQH